MYTRTHTHTYAHKYVSQHDYYADESNTYDDDDYDLFLMFIIDDNNDDDNIIIITIMNNLIIITDRKQSWGPRLARSRLQRHARLPRYTELYYDSNTDIYVYMMLCYY